MARAQMEQRLSRSEKARQLLTEQNLDLRWMLTILRDATSRYDSLRQFADEIVSRIQRFLPCDSGSLMMLERTTKDLRIMGAQGLNERERTEISFKLGEGFAGRAFESGNVVWSNDPNRHPSFVRIDWQERKFDNLLSCPFLIGARSVAVLSLHNRQPAGRFSKDDVERVRELAVHLAPVFELAQLSEDLRYQSRFDELSGCFRGDRFQGIAEEAIRRGAAQHAFAHVLLLDVDRFKEVNDALGHDSGNLVIQALGKLLRDLYHGRDGALASRLGGDEFIILLLSHSPAEAQEQVSAVRERVENLDLGTLGLDVGKLGRERLQVSIGVSSFPLGSAREDAYRDAIRKADSHMYEEKRQKRLEASARERQQGSLRSGGLNEQANDEETHGERNG